MGKYPPSKLRAAYSEWHYKKLNPNSFGMDVDFIETKKVNGKYIPIAFLEIQRVGSRLTYQEIDIYEWLIKNTGHPVYIISTDEKFTTFNVRHYGTYDEQVYSEHDFILWSDGLRGYKSLNTKKDVDWNSINELKQPTVHNHTQQSLRI